MRTTTRSRKYQFWDSGAAATSAYFWTPDQRALGCQHHHRGVGRRSRQCLDPGRHGDRLRDAVGPRLRRHRLGGLGYLHADDDDKYRPVATINDHSLHVNQWVKPQKLAQRDRRGRRYDYTVPVLGRRRGRRQRLLLVLHQCALGGRHRDRCFGRRSRQFLAAQRAARGSETMYVRAFDGTAWSNWDSFALDVDEYGPRRDDQRSYVECRAVGPTRQLDLKHRRRRRRRDYANTSSGTVAGQRTAPISGRPPIHTGRPARPLMSRHPIWPNVWVQGGTAGRFRHHVHAGFRWNAEHGSC